MYLGWLCVCLFMMGFGKDVSLKGFVNKYFPSDIGVCPSYGGMHVARHGNRWHLHGIRYADPSDRGPCFDNTVIYTDLNSYIDWIVKYIK